MMRQTDIPAVPPGTAITADLINALRAGANQGRLVTGDGGTNVSMIGSRVSIGSVGRLNPNTEYLVNVIAPAATLYPKLPALGGGCYWGSIYTQSNAFFNVSNSALEVPDPIPPIPTCIVANVAEDGHKGYGIVKSKTSTGRFTGWATPKNSSIVVPVLAVRIECYVSISFLITSTTSTVGVYNAKSIAPGSSTNAASSYGTKSATEDLIVCNGAEYGVAPSSNLLTATNTAAFGVMGSGTVVGVDSATGKLNVNTWMGFAGC